MTPFYNTVEKQAQFVGEATGFLGTPFHHHGRVKGGGVDCVGLLAELYIATGAATRVVLPKYRINEWNVLKDSKVKAFLTGSLEGTLNPGLKMVEIGPELSTLLPGDIITVSVASCVHHVGAMTWPTAFVHVLIVHGVVITNLAHRAYKSRLSSVHRIVTL
jgi:cell wall-associated NlpC family hydrolase